MEEDHCPQDPKNCTEAAGLGALFPAMHRCFNNDTAVKAASERIDAICTAHPHEFWPYVRVNDADVLGPDGKPCMQDSCVIPILPVLCKAYKGSPKPKSCQLLEQGLLTVA